MTDHPRLERAHKVLMVEGYSDLIFYAEFLEHLELHGQVFIKHFNGRSDLETKLETFATPQLLAGKDAVAVVIDADSDGQATADRFASDLRKLTGQVGVSCGAWITGAPRVGLCVVPAADAKGEIETLVWQAWSADNLNQKAVDCIDAYLACMSEHGDEAQSPDKGRIGALLAVKNDEDPRLGPGARARVFDLGRPEFKALADFLLGLGD